MSRPFALVCMLAAALLPGATRAQTGESTNYTSFDLESGRTVEIGNYASAGRNCAPGPTPTIKVVEPPKSGTLSVSRVERVFNVRGCLPIKMPAELLTYQAREHVAGSDHFVYDLIAPNGQIATHDVTIRISAPPKPVVPPKPEIKL